MPGLEIDDKPSDALDDFNGKSPAAASTPPGGSDFRGRLDSATAEARFIGLEQRIDRKLERLEASIERLSDAVPSPLEKRVVIGVLVLMASKVLGVDFSAIKSLVGGG